MTTDPTELDKAIREVLSDSFMTFADREVDQAISELYRQRAAEFRDYE